MGLSLGFAGVVGMPGGERGEEAALRPEMTSCTWGKKCFEVLEGR